jgi:hypothetical protein
MYNRSLKICRCNRNRITNYTVVIMVTKLLIIPLAAHNILGLIQTIVQGPTNFLPHSSLLTYHAYIQAVFRATSIAFLYLGYLKPATLHADNIVTLRGL